MGSRALKAGAGAPNIVALSIAVTLTSCSSSPKTTYLADNVDAVTADWEAYPGRDDLPAYEFDVVYR
ncbi:hypothetical protein E3T37_12780 [Cryobacterium sp. TMT2-10]|uniref:hypothetical protein n=1 Tax=Cryobacterium sp. TMT2-10 TaxID=1259244 RepID=UPI00106A4944|nr:hypothetical protein [Cryobacterium sp. TMT2-10]TFD37063.1 hypothetical protein E3T37_12780 [Cryobacterium sp. TMT2-10]